MNIRTLAYIFALTFTCSVSQETNFKIGLSKGLGFYTIGDYDGVEQTISAMWYFNPKWGVEINYNTFDYESLNFRVYRCHAQNYGINAVKSWSPFRMIGVNVKAGLNYHHADLEETFATFWANGENFDWLETTFHDFLRPETNQIPLGAENYRFYAELPNEKGISVVNITEITRRNEFGYSLAFDLIFKYRRIGFLVSPTCKMLLGGEFLVWSIGTGIGMDL
jgi:hypothetical protein